ncbi:hypothetical protein CJP46_06605 [Paenibacillus sp. XY044]|nr:hypothetical protein CJP46_06605 [Paenibacillus sp. XY044]
MWAVYASIAIENRPIYPKILVSLRSGDFHFILLRLQMDFFVIYIDREVSMRYDFANQLVSKMKRGDEPADTAL